MEKRYYIAYGSNLNVHQMRMRCPSARRIGTSVLKGYALLFKGSKTGSYLTVEKKPGSSVPVGVWEVTPADEKALDRDVYKRQAYHRVMSVYHLKFLL